jgi:hypothetical protein
MKLKFFIGIILGIALWSCGQQSEAPQTSVSEVAMLDMEEAVPMEKAVSDGSEVVAQPESYVSSSAAVENKQDETRKFIRTATLKFKVKDVIKSTYDIEGITVGQGGFVTYTHLQSEIDNTNTTNISADSSLVSTYYTVVNSMELRVPNVKLDTTLKEIARNIDFLDYRTIRAQDVALQMLANNLTQRRAIRQEQVDNAQIANLSLADQINFSTITLHIYQTQSVKHELVSNDKNITAYEPGLGSQLLDSLRFGWDILTTIIVFLVKLWGLILPAIVVYIAVIVYKKYKK